MTPPKSIDERLAREAWAAWSEQSEPGTDWASFWAGWRAHGRTASESHVSEPTSL